MAEGSADRFGGRREWEWERERGEEWGEREWEEVGGVGGRRLLLEEIGFGRALVDVPSIPEQIIRHYHVTRDYPGVNGCRT